MVGKRVERAPINDGCPAGPRLVSVVVRLFNGWSAWSIAEYITIRSPRNPVVSSP